jgi:hypothetical protein
MALRHGALASAPSVENQAGRGAGKVNDGRGYVEVVHELRPGLVLRKAGAAHHQRYLDRFLVGRGLADQPMLAKEKSTMGTT